MQRPTRFLVPVNGTVILGVCKNNDIRRSINTPIPRAIKDGAQWLSRVVSETLLLNVGVQVMQGGESVDVELTASLDTLPFWGEKRGDFSSYEMAPPLS